MTIPLLEIDSKGRPNPTGICLDRESFHRSASIPPSDRNIHPALHVALYDNKARVLEQLRSKTKKFLPRKWLSVNGGHGAKIDLHRKNSHYVFDWTGGAVRELEEELGIIVDRKELRIIDEQLVDFTKDCGFENKAYLKIYSLQYDPEKHGELKINHSEIEAIRFRKATYHRQFGLLRVLGDEYASRVARKIVSCSRRVSKH